jgi:hypothetical protein
MSEGDPLRSGPNQDAYGRHQLEVDPMFKKILIAAAALTAMAFGASQADAHGYGYGYGYGYNNYSYSNYGYGHHNNYYSYTQYQPSCYTQSRPITIRVWDEYYCEYVFKTVYRAYQVCN